MYGRAHSRRVVDPDGTVRTKVVHLPREKWPVVIYDHHDAYVSWDDYLANQARLAANLTQAGARPPREGHALCQGIIYCGSCGHRMSTHYRDNGFAYYECSSKTDQMHTPTCRSITAETVDDAVAERLLDTLNPQEMALALAAADESHRPAQPPQPCRRTGRGDEPATKPNEPSVPSTPASRTTGSWPATSSPVGKHAWSPSPRAEKALTETQTATPPLPSRAELEALTGDVISLWHAPSTSPTGPQTADANPHR